MAKKKTTKKAAKKSAAKVETEIEATPEPTRKMQPSAESLISDGVVFNKSLSHMAKFAKNQKIWMTTDDYVGEFRVSDAQTDQGTEFRQIVSNRDSAIVELHYLQREYAKGNISYIDEEGKVIPNPNVQE